MEGALLKRSIRQLYEGEKLIGVRFRYGLLGFDITTVLFIIATSFVPSSKITEVFDVVFGVLILIDFSARLPITTGRWPMSSVMDNPPKPPRPSPPPSPRVSLGTLLNLRLVSAARASMASGICLLQVGC